MDQAGNGFGKVQQVNAARQPVIVVSQWVKGFDQADGGYGDMPSVFVHHVVAQGKEFACVEVMGPGFPAAADNRVDTPPGRGQ